MHLARMRPFLKFCTNPMLLQLQINCDRDMTSFYWTHGFLIALCIEYYIFLSHVSVVLQKTSHNLAVDSGSCRHVDTKNIKKY